MADLSQVENMTANKLLDIVNDKSQTKEMRAAAKRELSTRSMASDTTEVPRPKMNKGGDTKKKVPAIAISVGMVDAPKNGQNKAKMMRGGMANKKEHMYAAGGSVTDNAGLRALKASGPKGMEAYKKITGK